MSKGPYFEEEKLDIKEERESTESDPSICSQEQPPTKPPAMAPQDWKTTVKTPPMVVSVKKADVAEVIKDAHKQPDPERLLVLLAGYKRKYKSQRKQLRKARL